MKEKDIFIAKYADNNMFDTIVQHMSLRLVHHASVVAGSLPAAVHVEPARDGIHPMEWTAREQVCLYKICLFRIEI